MIVCTHYPRVWEIDMVWMTTLGLLLPPDGIRLYSAWRCWRWCWEKLIVPTTDFEKAVRSNYPDSREELT